MSGTKDVCDSEPALDIVKSDSAFHRGLYANFR